MPSPKYIIYRRTILHTQHQDERIYAELDKRKKGRNPPRPTRPYFSVFGKLFLKIIGKSRAAAPKFCFSEYEITFRFANTNTDLEICARIQRPKFRSSLEEVHCSYDGISASKGIRPGLDPRI